MMPLFFYICALFNIFNLRKFMFNRISRMLLVAVLSLCASYSYAQCEAKLKEFYVTYMQNAEKMDDSNAKLLEAHMSPELIAKMAEYSEQYGADAIIHAQDVCQYGIQSLRVISLDSEDGYLVKYKWSPESNETFIPVRGIEVDGKLKIIDIFPVGSEPDGKSYI